MIRSSILTTFEIFTLKSFRGKNFRSGKRSSGSENRTWFWYKILSCAILGMMIFALCGETMAAEEGAKEHTAALFFRKTKTFVTDENSVEHGVVLLDFFNDACRPCRAMMPAVDSLVQRGFRVSKINTDKFPDWAERFNITKIPCFIVVVDGKEVSRHVGETSEQFLENMIVQAGGKPNLRPQRLNPSSRTKVQIAQSAWTGRETNLSTQDIMAGRYDFSRQLEKGETSAQVASSVQPSKIPSTEKTLPYTPVSRELASGASAANAGWNAAVDAETFKNRILASTVRIHVYASVGGKAPSVGTGTGTLIDCRSGHALILTCGHLFREFQKNDSITADFFTPQGVRTLKAKYVAHDIERDLGLLAVEIREPIETMPVAAPNFLLQKGMPIFTAGCSFGADPTIQNGEVTCLNRYLKTPNIETSALPVTGRSGGGLFTANGELIGVCSAADPEYKEGIFISLSAIHEYVQSLEMERFVLSPVNESKPSANGSENVIALQDLPNSSTSNGSESAAGNWTAAASNGNANQNGTPKTYNSFVPVSQTADAQTGASTQTPRTAPTQENAGIYQLKEAEPTTISLSEMDTVSPITPAQNWVPVQNEMLNQTQTSAQNPIQVQTQNHAQNRNQIQPQNYAQAQNQVQTQNYAQAQNQAQNQIPTSLSGQAGTSAPNVPANGPHSLAKTSLDGSSVNSNEPVSMVPERTLTGEKTPDWPPRWEE